MTDLTMTSSCATVTLLIDWAGQENSITKNIVVFNFWDESSLETVDKGINARPLMLKGLMSDSYVVGSSVATNVNRINAMMNDGAEVSISTEGDCINGVYIIQNFSYSTIKGLPDTFSFTLSLEFVREI